MEKTIAQTMWRLAKWICKLRLPTFKACKTMDLPVSISTDSLSCSGSQRLGDDAEHCCHISLVACPLARRPLLMDLLRESVLNHFQKGLGITSVLTPALPPTYLITGVPDNTKMFKHCPSWLLDGSRIDETNLEKIFSSRPGILWAITFEYPRSSPKSTRRLPTITKILFFRKWQTYS